MDIPTYWVAVYTRDHWSRDRWAITSIRVTRKAGRSVKNIPPREANRHWDAPLLIQVYPTSVPDKRKVVDIWEQ